MVSVRNLLAFLLGLQHGTQILQAVGAAIE